MGEKILRFLFIFSVTYVVLLWMLPNQDIKSTNQIIFSSDDEYTIWEVVRLEIENQTAEVVEFEDSCPNYYFKVERNILGEKEDITNSINTENCAMISLKPWEKQMFDFWENNIKLFDKKWNYKFIAKTTAWKEFETNFEISEPWFFVKYIWNAFIYKPIYNALIFLITVLPWMDLWFWIIALTILLKIILIIPSHKALKGQKAMQKIQPEINKIKQKYKWDKQKIAKETMEVWKKHKANPLWSCLPMLIQFPILISIFWIINDWLNVNSSYLLYSYFGVFDYSLIETNFLWILDLTTPNIIILPLMVWGLQFLQMHLSFAKNIPTEPKSEEGGDFMQQQMQSMGKMMKYFMPIMIAVFTATLPAAVWLYWWVSTLFATVQQIFVNQDSDTPKKSKKDKYKDVEDAVVVSEPKKHTSWAITKIKV